MKQWTSSVVVAAAIALFLVTQAGAQISPGELVTAHAKIDGSRSCLECHAQGQGVDPDKCLACHEILAETIEASAGLHSNPGYEDCRICHIDHYGRDYELIWWGDDGFESFDHKLTGEPLTGAHREVACRDCHKADFIADPDRFRQADKDLDRTFLGMPKDCAGCHEDEHRGQLSTADCSSCHATQVWAPTEGFDHENTTYPLTGAHVRTTCDECHREESDSRGQFQRFRPVEHSQCSECHRDAHEGALGSDCASCHATESWFTTPGFDHSRTRYPLTGRHRQVGCGECHRKGDENLVFRHLAFTECSDCHSDPHEARLGVECSSCHSTADWTAIPEGSFDHATTRYPLEGAHATVECRSCHVAGESLSIPGFDKCSSCHDDEHLGQFADRTDGGACESCHTVTAFLPTLFGEQDHAATEFPLEGLHRGVACIECHGEVAFRPRDGGEPVLAAKFRYEDQACAACHEDPHAGTAVEPCATCHSDTGWEVSTFDHSTTTFALEGGHADVECEQCHAVELGPEDERRLTLTDTPTDCAACHEEPHGGQFSGREGDCASCHTVLAWADLLFDHNRDSTYALDGAHAAAPCAACHLPEAGTQRADKPDAEVVRYVPLESSCEACHSG